MTSHRIFQLLILVWLAVFILGLGSREIDYDETRRIYPAMAMMDTGNWLAPVFEGEAYNRKPPLFNWLVAGSLAGFGQVNELSVRFPSALAVLVLLAYLAFAKSGWLEPRSRLLAGLILTTVAGFYGNARDCGIDGCYAVAVGLAVLCWLDRFSLGHRGFSLWAWPAVALGFALLLKGPLALVVFYVAVLMVLRSAGELRREALGRGHWAGVAIALGMFFAWVVAREYLAPLAASSAKLGLFETWKVELTQRLFANSDGGRPFRFGSWIEKVFGGIGSFLPWLLFWPLLWMPRYVGALADKGNGATFVRAGRWAVVVLTAMVLAMPLTKARYLLPVFPLAGVLLAHLLVANNESLPAWLTRTWRTILLILSWVLPVGTLLFALFLMDGRYTHGIRSLLAHLSSKPILPDALFAQVMPATLGTGLGLVGLFGAGAIMLRRHRHRLHTAFLLASTTALLAAGGYATVNVLGDPLQRTRDRYRPLAAAVVQQLSPRSPLLLYDVGLGEPFLFYLVPRHALRFVFPRETKPGPGNHPPRLISYRRQTLFQANMPFEPTPEACVEALAESPFLLANAAAIDSRAFRNLVRTFELTPLTQTGYKDKRFILYRISPRHEEDPAPKVRERPSISSW